MRQMRWMAWGAGLLACTVAALGGEVKSLTLQYRKSSGGTYRAVLHNSRATPATAYVADATYVDGGRERHTAMGGDTLGFTNGEDAEIGPGTDADTGRTLPRNGMPDATRVLAVIYADGVTEGEDDVIAMLMSGRHRALADLKESLPLLEKAPDGAHRSDSLVNFFEKMQNRDQAEGASLDEMQDAPGRMRYRYFMSAVPTQAVQALQSGATPAELLTRFRSWRDRLATSKPDVR